MRDISRKSRTLRSATATARLIVRPSTIELVRKGEVPKGDPFPVAKVAAIQAAKNTSQIIPYCHSLPIDFIDCTFTLKEQSIVVETQVKAIHRTGVEMEALTAVSVAALTLYDMLKMVDDTMEIQSVRLTSKKGGKSGFKSVADRPLSAAVVVMSDSAALGKAEDTSGVTVTNRLRDAGFEISECRVIPDDAATIEHLLVHYADEMHLDAVVTTGGTGLGLRDVTPEATRKVIEREIPGIAEALRAHGQERTPYSMLSRALAGVRGETVIVNLPGSPASVEESLDLLLPALCHLFDILRNGEHLNGGRKTTGGQADALT